jgi:hypothetical protein
MSQETTNYGDGAPGFYGWTPRPAVAIQFFTSSIPVSSPWISLVITGESLLVEAARGRGAVTWRIHPRPGTRRSPCVPGGPVGVPRPRKPGLSSART